MSHQTQSNILRELMVLAVPIIISQGAYAFMIFTDRYFMAQLSATHISASMSGGVTAYVTLSLFLGMVAYANALVAQYFGASELHKCSKVVTQGIILAILVAPVLALMSYPTAGLFSLMGHSDELIELETIYYQVLIWGGVFSLAKAALSSFFSGIGRAWVVMVCDLTGVLLNIVLSYGLIFGRWGLPEMGIAGAALGTVIATACTLGLFLGFYLQKELKATFSIATAWVFDKAIVAQYLRFGFPSGLEAFMNVVTFNLFLLMFQTYGVNEGAAMAIVFNWDLLSFISMVGLHIALMSLSGRMVGSRRYADLNKVILSGLGIALLVTTIVAVLFAVFRYELVSVFDTGDVSFGEIRELAVLMMVGLAIYVIADGLNLVASGVLRGAGDTRWLMVMSVSLHWLMLIAQVMIIKVWQLGPMVSWWAFVSMLMCLAVAYLYRLKWGPWRDPERLARFADRNTQTL